VIPAPRVRSRRAVVTGLAAAVVAGGLAAGGLLLRRARTHPGGTDRAAGTDRLGPAALTPGIDRHALPADTEERFLTMTDGACLRVLARGDGPAVVLVHGITLAADVWANQLRDLGDAGYRVVAPDLRGHGRSGVGAGGLSLDRFADDLDELLRQLDLDRVVLVGHSMGGMLALRLLTRPGRAGALRGVPGPLLSGGTPTRAAPAPSGADAPGRVRALALVATSASPVVGRGVPGARAVVALAGPLLGAAGRLALSLPGPSLPDSDRGEPLARLAFGASASPRDVRLVRRLTAGVPAHVAAALLVQLVSFDAERDLARVPVPTTVVVGTEDRMTPRRHAETLAEAIPGADLVVLADCGHMVMLERPAELAAVIERLAASGASPPPGAGTVTPTRRDGRAYCAGMVKLIVLYGPPEDPGTFDNHYFSTHIPLVEKMSGVRRLEVAKLASLDGSPSPYYLSAELHFDSAEAMTAAFGTDEGKAATADVANFATGGVTMLSGQVVQEG
jgi:non-heme chloroperoxidase